MNCVKRIALMVIRNILLVPFMWCKLCYYAAHVDKYPEITRYKLLKYIVKRANKGGNVTIEAYGKENIPKEGGFMFFPNHQGLYDVLAIVDACPRPFSVVAKKEVANVPLLKQTFKCMKAYMIDREDIRQSMQVIMDVTEEVKKGRNYLIFAEGTRSKMGNKLLEFKGGSFKAATKAKCPITELVFCAIQGNYTGDPVRIPLRTTFFSILKDLLDRHIIGVDMVNDGSGVDIITGNTVVIIA